MSIVLAVPRAYDAVVERFATEGTACDFAFGWRENMRQVPSSRRIVWQPGDPSGAVGDVGAARFPGRNPRPLGTLDELVTIYVEARDDSNPENERAQYQAARELFDALVRALYLAARGNYTIASSKWDNSKNLRRRGAMLVVVVVFASMIPDAPLETAPTDTVAAIKPSLDTVDDDVGTEDPEFTVSPA